MFSGLRLGFNNEKLQSSVIVDISGTLILIEEMLIMASAARSLRRTPAVRVEKTDKRAFDEAHVQRLLLSLAVRMKPVTDLPIPADLANEL